MLKIYVILQPKTHTHTKHVKTISVRLLVWHTIFPRKKSPISPRAGYHTPPTPGSTNCPTWCEILEDTRQQPIRPGTTTMMVAQFVLSSWFLYTPPSSSRGGIFTKGEVAGRKWSIFRSESEYIIFGSWRCCCLDWEWPLFGTWVGWTWGGQPAVR